jgi:hypothetical protein
VKSAPHPASQKGTPAVFISEQGKELLTIVNYPAATEHLGYYLEVTGKVDATAKTISIDSVNRLEFRGASCSRTAKKKASQ